MTYTEICKQECPVLSPLLRDGADENAVQQIIQACSAGLYDDCGAGQPVAAKKGDWTRCDLHPQVVDRITAVTAAIGAGVLSLENKTSNHI